jgi:hypothetical protein
MMENNSKSTKMPMKMAEMDEKNVPLQQDSKGPMKMAEMNEENVLLQQDGKGPMKNPEDSQMKSEKSKTKSNHSKYWNSCLFILTALAFVSRVWNISYPEEVVFDEIYFGRYSSRYLERKYFFDVV